MVWLLDYVANTPLRPWIVTQPASQTATVGDHVSFTVAADGSSPLVYQWRKDGVPIEGNASALSPTLMLASVLTADAGAYDCIVSNGAGSATSSRPPLTVHKAVGVVTLFDLRQIYDGAPRAVSFTTSPAGLTVDVTYNGSATPPTAPGSYAVIATINDANYTGSAAGTLIITTTVLVRHAPTLNGALNGSVQVLLPEGTTLNGGAAVSGDLLVPGTPSVRLNGRPDLCRYARRQRRRVAIQLHRDDQWRSDAPPCRQADRRRGVSDAPRAARSYRWTQRRLELTRSKPRRLRDDSEPDAQRQYRPACGSGRHVRDAHRQRQQWFHPWRCWRY